MRESVLTRRALLRATGTGIVAVAASGRTRAREPTQGTDYLRVPDHPYIVLANGAPLFRPRDNYGWERQSTGERTRTVRRLHPDLLDFKRLVWADGDDVSLPPGVGNQLEFSKRERLPATVGQTMYLRTDGSDAERIEWLRSQNGWERPGGEPVESAEDLLAERYDGRPQGYGVQGNEIGIPSVFAPATLDILLHEAEETLDAGFVSMFVDSLTTPRLQGLDFSPWATAAFRNHLDALSDDELDALDVDDPATFDVREAFRQRGLAPESTDDPTADPLFREYHLFHHRGMKEFTRAYRTAVNEAFPERGSDRSATLNANHYVGDTLASQPAAGIYTTDHMDYVTIEDNRTKPPEYVREPLYKLVRAATRGDKPVLVQGQMQSITGNDSSRGLDLDREYFTLRRLQFAEAYANGVPRKIPLTGWSNVEIDETITRWVDSDGSVPDELQSFADFLWTNQRFLRDPTPDNDVALVFSMPTMLWHRTPQWDRNAERQRAAFLGTAKALREAQIPYDVAIFGHPELWNDDWQLNRLSEYDAVVLPEVDCLSSAQSETLASVLDSDGTVVTAGRRPERNADYEPTSFEWLERDGVVALDESPTVDLDDDGESNDGGADSSGSRLGEVLSDVTSLTVDAPYPLAVNRLRKDGVEQVHLVNYDYDEESDSVAPATDVELTLTGTNATAARYVTPEGATDLDVARDGGEIRLRVPEVREWGFVLLADSTDAFESTSSLADARTAVEEVETLVSEADRTIQPARGRLSTLLDEARLALDEGAADLALERAERVRTELEHLDLVPEATTEASTRSPMASPTESPTTTSDPTLEESAADDGESADAETPGFGFGAGLSALGAGLLWRYVRTEGDS